MAGLGRSQKEIPLFPKNIFLAFESAAPQIVRAIGLLRPGSTKT
jgi:hypothetical protein